MAWRVLLSSLFSPPLLTSSSSFTTRRVRTFLFSSVAIRSRLCLPFTPVPIYALCLRLFVSVPQRESRSPRGRRGQGEGARAQNPYGVSDSRMVLLGIDYPSQSMLTTLFADGEINYLEDNAKRSDPVRPMWIETRSRDSRIAGEIARESF